MTQADKYNILIHIYSRRNRSEKSISEFSIESGIQVVEFYKVLDHAWEDLTDEVVLQFAEYFKINHKKIMELVEE